MNIETELLIASISFPLFLFSKDVDKVFQITFVTLAPDSCLALLWGDNSPVATYGHRETCQYRYSWATHTDTVLELSMNITHSYK